MKTAFCIRIVQMILCSVVENFLACFIFILFGYLEKIHKYAFSFAFKLIEVQP